MEMIRDIGECLHVLSELDWVKMSGDENLSCFTIIISSSHNAISFEAIGTSINAGNAANGYGRYHAIGRWHLPLL